MFLENGLKLRSFTMLKSVEALFDPRKSFTLSGISHCLGTSMPRISIQSIIVKRTALANSKSYFDVRSVFLPIMLFKFLENCHEGFPGLIVNREVEGF